MPLGRDNVTLVITHMRALLMVQLKNSLLWEASTETYLSVCLGLIPHLVKSSPSNGLPDKKEADIVASTQPVISTV